jgi:hypothetical protein
MPVPWMLQTGKMVRNTPHPRTGTRWLPPTRKPCTHVPVPPPLCTQTISETVLGCRQHHPCCGHEKRHHPPRTPTTNHPNRTLELTNDTPEQHTPAQHHVGRAKRVLLHQPGKLSSPIRVFHSGSHKYVTGIEPKQFDSGSELGNITTRSNQDCSVQPFVWPASAEICLVSQRERFEGTGNLIQVRNVEVQIDSMLNSSR